MAGLDGKVVAITEAASGIGLACARACLAQGAQVARADRDAASLDRVCADFGRGAHAVVIDLLDRDSVADMFPLILDKAGRLDVLHANAGSYAGGRRIM